MFEPPRVGQRRGALRVLARLLLGTDIERCCGESQRWGVFVSERIMIDRTTETYLKSAVPGFCS